jgi:hypothetical protein
MVGNPSKGPGGAQSQVQSRASLRPRAGGAVVRPALQRGVSKPKVDSESRRDGVHAMNLQPFLSHKIKTGIRYDSSKRQTSTASPAKQGVLSFEIALSLQCEAKDLLLRIQQSKRAIGQGVFLFPESFESSNLCAILIKWQQARMPAAAVWKPFRTAFNQVDA